MKIGFVGGSFNPPHFGHIELATVAMNHLGLDIVVFLVTPRNPFKSGKGLPAISERTKMLSKLIKTRRYKVSSIETKFKTAESFRTVRFVKSVYKNDDLYFIFGSDNIPHFHKWRNYKEILQTVNVVFVNRGGVNLHKIVAESRIPRNKLRIIYRKTYAISSTEIRERTK